MAEHEATTGRDPLAEATPRAHFIGSLRLVCLVFMVAIGLCACGSTPKSYDTAHGHIVSATAVSPTQYKIAVVLTSTAATPFHGGCAVNYPLTTGGSELLSQQAYKFVIPPGKSRRMLTLTPEKVVTQAQLTHYAKVGCEKA